MTRLSRFLIWAAVVRFECKENFDVQDVDIDGIKYQVPNFLINEQLPNSMSNKLIRKSLVFTRNMMTNKFFLPNNLVFPKSRIILENYFN